MTLSVGVDGAISSCRVTATSGSQALDKASCSLISERFRYEPARDADGRAIEAKVQRRVTWRMPQDVTPSEMAGLLAEMLPRFVSGEMRVAMVQDSLGPRCAVDTSGEAFLHTAEMACPLPLRVEWEEIIRDAGAQFSVTIVALEGAPAAARLSRPGTLLGRSAAEVQVGPDGRMEQCRDLPVVPAQAGHSICRAMNSGMPVFAPEPQSSPRRGRLEAEFYRQGLPET